MRNKEDSPGVLREMHGVLRSYVARRLGLARHWRHVRRFTELQSEEFWFGGAAGGAVTVTAGCIQLTRDDDEKKHGDSNGRS